MTPKRFTRGDAGPSTNRTTNGQGDLQLTGQHGVYVLHPRGVVPGPAAEVAESLRGVLSEDLTVLVTADLSADRMGELISLIGPLVEHDDAAAPTLVRLVMSEAAGGKEGNIAPARLLSDGLGVDVLSPAGPAVVVPGGTLFAPLGLADRGGWWYMTPHGEAQHCGMRHPLPSWEAGTAKIDPGVAPGHLVEHIPAGLLVQPLTASPEGVEALRYAVPVDHHRACLVVGVPGAAPVSAEALESVLAALPRRVRENVRLLPGDGRDLMPTAQEVSEALGLRVEVVNGLPVFLEQDTFGSDGPQVMLVDPDGMPAWRPFIESSVCLPSTGASSQDPQIVSWRSPDTRLADSADPGVLMLDKRWQVSLTRAGFWAGPVGGSAPVDRTVESDIVAVDLGLPGRGLDESFWPLLDRFLGSLEGNVRERAMIQVHGNTSAAGMKELRRMTVRHGLVLAPNGWHTTAAPAISRVTRTNAPISPPTTSAEEPGVATAAASTPAQVEAPRRVATQQTAFHPAPSPAQPAEALAAEARRPAPAVSLSTVATAVSSPAPPDEDVGLSVPRERASLPDTGDRPEESHQHGFVATPASVPLPDGVRPATIAENLAASPSVPTGETSGHVERESGPTAEGSWPQGGDRSLTAAMTSGSDPLLVVRSRSVTALSPRGGSVGGAD